jgi:hypothetical protein
VKINFLVLRGPPESLDENVVKDPCAPVLLNPDALRLGPADLPKEFFLEPSMLYILEGIFLRFHKGKQYNSSKAHLLQ